MAKGVLPDIHDRMPVIIPPGSYDPWLSTLDPDPQGLLVPYPAAAMKMWPISTGVNKPEKDDAEILDPIEAQEGDRSCSAPAWKTTPSWYLLYPHKRMLERTVRHGEFVPSPDMK